MLFLKFIQKMSLELYPNKLFENKVHIYPWDYLLLQQTKCNNAKE